MTPGLDRLLQRDRAITIAGLAVLCALAWLYVVSGAALGRSAWAMTTLSLFPHKVAAAGAQAMPGMAMGAAASEPAAWGPGRWALMIAMWWAMMIAMMTPSAAPTILLYAQAHRDAAARGQVQRAVAPTGAFAAGYLTLWLAFCVAAAALSWGLERAHLVSMMGSQSRWLSAGVLVAAGLYQLSPLQGRCLAHCRAPAAFLARHWRPGPWGAMRLGLLHGAYCVGCCWLLMALLFIGGVMNLAWIAALAIVVLAEKLLPAGKVIGRALAATLVVWGLATLLI